MIHYTFYIRIIILLKYIYIYIIYILSENILYVLNINNNKYNINFSKQETFYLKRYILHFYFINNC